MPKLPSGTATAPANPQWHTHQVCSPSTPRPFQALAAMAANRVIGAGNKTPWHMSDDLKWFKSKTTGRHVLMGRKTFESLGRPLPGRYTLVLTRHLQELIDKHPGIFTKLRELRNAHESRQHLERDRQFDMLFHLYMASEHRRLFIPVKSPSGAGLILLRSRDHLIDFCRRFARGRPVFVCGGANIYAQFLPHCSDLFLTQRKKESAGDCSFPPFEEQFDSAGIVKEHPDFIIEHFRHRN
ncbi:MAG: Dihydrofolate reductase [Verrucomicrobia subdivision 3 bacterium]|nr:Dihydrofolate reductase [Limisphaerales bacterium]MCS1417762.1 Dihydrofolate reductase [Limisphaerales bacterium]